MAETPWTEETFPAVLESSAIDEHIDSRKYQTPIGGEVEIDSGETFDYPTGLASDEKMKRLYAALDEVLNSYTDEPGRRQGFRDELVKSLDNRKTGETIEQILQSMELRID